MLATIGKNIRLFNIKKCSHGTYQIDGYIEYQVLGVKIKVLIECKMYKSKIERKVVTELYSKLQSLGANKGIIMSTSGFQSGAQEFALAHGIALIQVVNDNLLNIQQSFNPNIELLKEQVRRTPKYVPLMYDLNWQFPMYQLLNELDAFENFLCS